MKKPGLGTNWGFYLDNARGRSSDERRRALKTAHSTVDCTPEPRSDFDFTL